MTRVYFVRHAQPEHDWEEDRTRPSLLYTSSDWEKTLKPRLHTRLDNSKNIILFLNYNYR